MHEVIAFVLMYAGSPLGRFWLFSGLFAGAVYGLLRRKHRLELFCMTALVIVPPLVVLPLSLTMIKSNSNFWIWIGLMANVLYVMTGFVAFCMTWAPGVTVGYLFGRAIERRDQGGTKT